MKNFRSQNKNKEEVRVILSDPIFVDRIATCLRDNRIWVWEEPQPVSADVPEAVGGFIVISGSKESGKSTLAELFCSEVHVPGKLLVNSDAHPPRAQARFLGIRLDKIKEKIAVRVCVTRTRAESDMVEVLCRTIEQPVHASDLPSELD